MSDFNQENNRAVWFDIPVADLSRACDFYAGLLAVEVERSEFDGFHMGIIDHGPGNGACLYVKPEEISSTGGLLVYFNAEGRIRDAVAKASELGGKILEDTHAIGPHGFRAILLDSEGNRIAVHSIVDA